MIDPASRKGLTPKIIENQCELHVIRMNLALHSARHPAGQRYLKVRQLNRAIAPIFNHCRGSWLSSLDLSPVHALCYHAASRRCFRIIVGVTHDLLSRTKMGSSAGNGSGSGTSG